MSSTSSVQGDQMNEQLVDEDVLTARDRKPTEKGLKWQLDRTRSNFRVAISAWRRHAGKIEGLLIDSHDSSLLKGHRDALEGEMNEVFSLYDQLRKLLDSADQENTEYASFEKIELENYQIMKKFSDRMKEIEVNRSEIGSISSSRSGRSRQSDRSNTSRKEVAADVAAMEVKLKCIEPEAQQRAQFERVQAQRDLEIAQARLQEIERIDKEERGHLDLNMIPSQEDGMNEYVANYVESQNMRHTDRSPQRETEIQVGAQPPTLIAPPVPISTSGNVSVTPLNPLVGSYVPRHQPQSTWIYSPITPDNRLGAQNNGNQPLGATFPDRNQTENVSQQQIFDLTRSFAEQISLSRLPPPEPSVFSGDPISYPAWKSSFDTLIDQRGIPPNERIHYLKKYLGGSAREAIEGYFLLSTDDAYDEARLLLEERYGGSFVVATAFRNKLRDWPNIDPRDGLALRKFTDYLRQCEKAMATTGHLSILDDSIENRRLLQKLPTYLVTSWGRIVADWEERKKGYPPFKEFTRYLVKEANIACHPVTSLQALKSSDKQGESSRKSAYKGNSGPVAARSLATESSEAKSEQNKDEKSKRCAFCRKGHEIDFCKAFLSKTWDEKKDIVMQRGFCFGCLEHGHISSLCPERMKCKTCNGKHPTSLHRGTQDSYQKKTQAFNTKTVLEGTGSNENETELKAVSHRTKIKKLDERKNVGKSSMVVPVWVSHQEKPDKEILVYALLDTQSDATFILEETCDELQVQGQETKLRLSTMLAEDMLIESRKVNGLMIRAHDSVKRMPLPVTYSRNIIPVNREHIPTKQMALQWPHLEKIADKLMPIADCNVGLLIGYNCPQALVPREVIPPEDNGPYAERTDLGWGIVGIIDPDQIQVDECDPIGRSHLLLTYNVPHESTLPEEGRRELDNFPTQVQMSLKTSVKEVFTPIEAMKMMELDFHERKSGNDDFSQDDLKFLRKVKDGIYVTEDDHYELPLPFKEDQPKLPNNKVMAMHRLRQLRKRLRNDTNYERDYVAFMKEVIHNGFAEKVPVEELDRDDGAVYFLPHHGVYHPKKPNKIRVVFDCSAQFKGESLNDHLLRGPDLTNALVGVLCRFRKEQVAFMCDIEQMFFQFKVNVEQRDFLRFLWWENGSYEDNDVTEYRMNVHLFGAASSPGCANYCLKQAANDYEEEFGSEPANFIRNDFYVDDGLKSVPTDTEAIDVITKSQNLCAKRGLRLHKIVSNSKKVMEMIAPEDRAKGLKDLNFLQDSLPVERALGVQWCVESDSFQFRITIKDQPLTRRGILSTVSSVYDPLGFIAPVVIVGKQILQEMCRGQTDWDSPLPEELRPRWEKWRNELIRLEDLKIQRCFKPAHFGKIVQAELHHFSDASTVGYGQCSYLRLVDEQQQVHCSLVMGKARVTPLKTVTIPRLELTAALLSVKISNLLKEQLEHRIDHEVFWTDSNVVLGYIANDSKRFHVFVANRVQQIRDHTSPTQWRHVRTHENPADEASRGLSADELVSESKWLKGPNFLLENEIPNPTEQAPERVISHTDPEVKKVKVFTTQTEENRNQFDLTRLQNFSSWFRAKRAIAACLKLKAKILNKIHGANQMVLRNKGQLYEPVQVKDLRTAELEIIRLTQQEAFEEEIKILKHLKVNDSNLDSKGRPIRPQTFLDRPIQKLVVLVEEMRD